MAALSSPPFAVKVAELVSVASSQALTVAASPKPGVGAPEVRVPNSAGSGVAIDAVVLW